MMGYQGFESAWPSSGALLLLFGCGVNVERPIDRGPVPKISVGTGLTPSGTRQTPPNATAFSQTCGPDEVVTGYEVTAAGLEAGQQLESLQGFCSAVSVDWGAGLRVVTTPSAPMAAMGMTGGAPQTQRCPDGEMVVAFSGRSGSDIDQLAIACAPLLIYGAFPRYKLNLGAPEEQPGIGNLGGAPFATISCPKGQVAVGDEGRAATIVNTFGLLCAEVRLLQ